MKDKVVEAKSFQFWTGAVVVPTILAAAGIAVPWVCYRTPDLPETFQVQLHREFRAAIDSNRKESARQKAELDEIEASFLREQGANYRGAVSELRAQTTTRLALSFESMERGKALVQAGRYREARDEFHSAVTLDPESAFAWSNLGAVATLIHDLRTAREAYDRARLLAPDDPLILYNFGLVLAEQGEIPAALEHIGRALRGAPRETRQTLAADLRANPTLRKHAGDQKLQALLKEASR